MLVPVTTLLKLTLACDTARFACTPVPVTPTAVVPCPLTMETEPLIAVGVVGLNFTFRLAVCPGVSVSGVLTPLTAKPCPLTPICETVAELFPAFVIVIV